MNENIHAHYFAWRRTDANASECSREAWLYARVNFDYLQNQFFQCEDWQKPTWDVAFNDTGGTWFKTFKEAKARARCKAIKKDKDKPGVRWDLVECKLILHTKVAHTTVEDVVSKLGLLAEGLSDLVVEPVFLVA
jgi:hypothetical protein